MNDRPTAKEIDTEVVSRLIEAARTRGDATLVGPDAMAIARAVGIRCPRSVFVSGVPKWGVVETEAFGDQIVVKAVSPHLVHKTDVGAVAIVRNRPELVAATIRDMARRLESRGVIGFTLDEWVAHDAAFGGELLAAARWTDDFGPVLVIGPGGVSAEFVAAHLTRSRNLVMLSPSLPLRRGMGDTLREAAVVEFATTPHRGTPARLSLRALEALVGRVGAFARHFMPMTLAEFEINPLVVSNGELVALDARVMIGHEVTLPVPRPLEKLRRLLRPDSIAVVGVSEGTNPGRMLLRNVLREGFDASRLFVVKRGLEQIDGCRCVPSLASLPAPVDLLVLSIAAPEAAPLAVEAIESGAAESLVIIPGGFEETEGGTALATRVRTALDAARLTPAHGPVVNGPNCVGVRSMPGRYDATFIPDTRPSAGSAPVVPIAIVAQSGAFALSMLDKLPGTRPRYCITVGNQIDLTIGDYVRHLASEPDVDLIAVYVEGFKPLDGAAFLQAASEITASGRTLLLYRAGRTPAGRRASSTHTAAMAGDYDITRALARQAGVVLAETLADFEDLLKLFALLHDRPVEGWRLGAVSNAGFECVALADNLGAFRPAEFGPDTRRRVQTVLQLSRVGALVDVNNPLDLTPMIGDAAYEEIARAVLADDGVDVGIIGCVPMTPAVHAVPEPQSAGKTFAPDSIVTRLARIRCEERKPWVCVVAGGESYDPMVARLESAGLPTFRSIDRAVRVLEIFCGERILHAQALRREYSTDPFEMPEAPCAIPVEEP
jgi:acyl-CoA synthetase (NDP forming)